jgi:hypothetical protein
VIIKSRSFKIGDFQTKKLSIKRQTGSASPIIGETLPGRVLEQMIEENSPITPDLRGI